MVAIGVCVSLCVFVCVYACLKNWLLIEVVVSSLIVQAAQQRAL